MSPTIKGPIRIKVGEPLPKELDIAIKSRVAKKLGIVLQPARKPTKPTTQDKKYTREQLEAMSFSELREIGRKLRVRGRSKPGLIDDIVAIQEGRKEPEI